MLRAVGRYLHANPEMSHFCRLLSSQLRLSQVKETFICSNISPKILTGVSKINW
jgi:hypothetical protein